MQELHLHLGDCVAHMAGMPASSIGALCGDPPYGISFMSKGWDKLDWSDGGGMAKVGLGGRNIPWPSYSGTGAAGTANATCATCAGRMRGAKTCSCETPEWRVKGRSLNQNANALRMQAQQTWHRAWLVEAFRVLRPGGVIKVFGGTRVFHRLAAAMVEAGFAEIQLEAWAYGSGFPKSKNVALFLDKQAGAVGNRGKAIPMASTHFPTGKYAEGGEKLVSNRVKAYEPITDDAKAWKGWGTALKPAWEPVLTARKPT